MKIVLMIAAGIAVGFTVVIAVLVQILQQFAPLLVVLAVVVVVLRLTRGSRNRCRPIPTVVSDRGSAYVPALQVAPPLGGPEPFVEPLPYLRWGDVDSSVDLSPVASRPGNGLRRARAGVRPPARPARSWR